jgi:ABC-type transport system substrate-binding protein
MSAAFFAACGGSNKNGKNPTRTATTGGASAAPSAAASAAGSAAAATSTQVAAVATASPAAVRPKTGGALVHAQVSGEQAHQDPHLSSSGTLHKAGSGLAYSRLIKSKVGPGFLTTIVPDADIAQSWEQVDDVTYVFHLRPNAKWQNIAPVSGRAINAQDFVYSYGRQRDLKMAASFLPDTSQVQAVDPQTLRLQAPKPDVDFLTILSSDWNHIVAKEAVDVRGDLKDGPTIGSGAWIQKEYVPNNVIRFVKNPDFYLKDEFGISLPYMDTMDILRIADMSTKTAAFETGKTLFETFEADVTAQVRGRHPDFQYLKTKVVNANGGQSIVLNSAIAPTNDLRVRQAVSQAFDRKAFQDAIYGADGWIGGTIVHLDDSSWLLPEDELRKTLTYDPAAAKQLLQAAGATGWKPKITYYIGQDTTGEFTQAQMKNVAIDSTIVVMDNPGLAQWLNQHDREFVAFIRGTAIRGTNADLRASYKTGGQYNPSNMSDPQLDQMIEAQAGEKDKDKRKAALLEIQRRIVNYMSVIPLRSSFTNILFQPKLRNMWGTPYSTAEMSLYDHLWLDT